MKVFAAQYTDCIYESGMVTLSLHKTFEGAQQAILKSKGISKQQYDEMFAWQIANDVCLERYKWDGRNGVGYEKWGIQEMEVEE